MSRSPDLPTPAIRALSLSLVDYAGLFPPAKLPMSEAVQNHASYLNGPHSSILGRFVLPASRLAEFEEALRALPASARPLWELSVLGSPDAAADSTKITSFNSRQAIARIVSVEVKPNEPGDIEALVSLPPAVEVWIEVPATGPLQGFLEAVAVAGRGAKLRTGGITADAFPAPERVIEFFQLCHRLGLEAKATAGLHHALAGSYPLTYDSGSASARMYGFLNVILTAALLQDGQPDSLARQLLTDGEAKNFQCRPDAVAWRDVAFPTSKLERVRRTLVRSFGSCSFTEPIEGLHSLGWL